MCVLTLAKMSRSVLKNFICEVPMHLSVIKAILQELEHFKVIQFKLENTDFQIGRDAGVKTSLRRL
jgi:hypothetical protein